MARINVFCEFATVTDVASMAVIDPLNGVFLALTGAGAEVSGTEFVEVSA
jgi:hypothetical protein